MMRDPLQGTGAPGTGAESRRYDMLGGPVQNRPYDQVRQQRRRLGARVGKCRTTARWSWLRAQCAHARERERARITPASFLSRVPSAYRTVANVDGKQLGCTAKDSDHTRCGF